MNFFPQPPIEEVLGRQATVVGALPEAFRLELGFGTQAANWYAIPREIEVLRPDGTGREAGTLHPNGSFVSSESTLRGRVNASDRVMILGASVLHNVDVQAHTIIDNAEIVFARLGERTTVGPGVRISSTSTREPSMIGSGVSVGARSIIRSDKMIADGVKIGEGVIVINSVIANDTEIGSSDPNHPGDFRHPNNAAMTHVICSAIGKNVSIGPNAYVEHSVVRDGSQVGNRAVAINSKLATASFLPPDTSRTEEAYGSSDGGMFLRVNKPALESSYVYIGFMTLN